MVADAAPAEQFGPYLVYERLGIGGMATVHRALERGIEGFERFVALKRLLPHLAEDATFIKSFVREAKLASLLNHVNIVQIFELGRVGTEYFISMEYIDGRDIRRILRHARKNTGPPPIHVTVGLLLQLCEALDYAHTKVDEHGHPLRLVHRDISPSNLLITKAGHLKVIDFGIAKAQSSQHRTQTGRVKGKLAYMAPEAVAGKDLDARSDLFAVGVIGHELLTARPLFASKNEYQTLLKVQRGDIMPPSTFNQACPAELDALILKALARDPNERFGSAGELREQLALLRRRYNMQAGHRDVAQWIEWAFSVEAPSSSFGALPTFEQTGAENASYEVQAAMQDRRAGSIARGPSHDEDAAAELAWGGGEAAHDEGPVVLDDVPDVSDKHLAANPSASQIANQIDDPYDFEDDIPPPEPSHGLAPRARRSSSARSDRELAGPPRRNTFPGHGPEPRLPSRRSHAVPVRPSTSDSGPPERTSGVAEPHAAHSPSGTIPVDPTVPATELGTMRNLPPLPVSARVRAASVAPRDLPSLEPFLAAQAGRGGEEDDEHETVLLATTERRSRPATARPVIGAAIASRRRPAPRSSHTTWLLLAGLLVAGTVAGAIAIYAVRGSGEQAPPLIVEPPAPAPPQVPARTVGTVKFVTEPGDAEISVEGQPVHVGSPWALELAPGIHPISIQRRGFKAWLTSLELSANETQTLRVVLEPLASATASQEATLILSTTPQGLEVVLDGQLLPQPTPIKMSIQPGRHVVAVRQKGAEVWRHEFDARASVDYEFTPSMTEDKQRERAERASWRRDRVAEARPAITDVDRARPGAGRVEEHRAESPSLPAIPAITPEPAPPLVPPAPVLEPPPAPPTAPAAKGPVLVAPTAVVRTGGATPKLNPSRNEEIPANVAAKLCIDAAGRVTSVDLLTKLERAATATDLTSTLKGWTYTPYKQQGVAVAACFVVNFHTK